MLQLSTKYRVGPFGNGRMITSPEGCVEVSNQMQQYQVGILCHQSSTNSVFGIKSCQQCPMPSKGRGLGKTLIQPVEFGHTDTGLPWECFQPWLRHSVCPGELLLHTPLDPVREVLLSAGTGGQAVPPAAAGCLPGARHCALGGLSQLYL